MFILHTWLEEKQGTIYRYFVETLAKEELEKIIFYFRDQLASKKPPRNNDYFLLKKILKRILKDIKIFKK